jgi:hypothetical protein
MHIYGVIILEDTIRLDQPSATENNQEANENNGKHVKNATTDPEAYPPVTVSQPSKPPSGGCSGGFNVGWMERSDGLVEDSGWIECLGSCGDCSKSGVGALEDSISNLR